MWIFNLVQRLSDGSIVSFRNESQQSTLGARRANMVEGWLFEELIDHSTPAFVRMGLFPNGVVILEPDITQPPSDLVAHVRPPILIEVSC